MWYSFTRCLSQEASKGIKGQRLTTMHGVGVQMGPTAVVPTCPPHELHHHCIEKSNGACFDATRPRWSSQIPAMLPKPHMRHLALQLPKLHRRLHHAATLGNAFDNQMSSTQGKHTFLVQQDCRPGTLLARAQDLLRLQASLRTRPAPTPAD